MGNGRREGNLILALIGLPFGLNNRKTYNYPIDNYSLHTSPQSQKMTLSSRTAARAGSTHVSHYCLRDRLACNGPHWVSTVGWTTSRPLVTSYRGTQPWSSQTSGKIEFAKQKGSCSVKGHRCCKSNAIDQWRSHWIECEFLAGRDHIQPGHFKSSTALYHTRDVILSQ